MYGMTVGVDLPKFHEILGRLAEFVYGASQWEPDLVTLRAGGLVPVARQYPGPGNSSTRTAKSSPGPTCPTRPRKGTRSVRSSSRPSSGPGQSTARNSET